MKNKQFILMLFFATLQINCQLEHCDKTKSSKNMQKSSKEFKERQCSLKGILGEKPLYEGNCQTDRTCWRRSKGRLSWVRCIDHHCLLGQGNPQKGHLFGISSLVYLNQSQIITGGDKGEIRLWDSDKMLTLNRWQGHEGAIRDFVIIANNRLLSVGDDEKIKLWSLLNGQLIREWLIQGKISNLAISPNHRWIIAANIDHFVWLGSIQSGVWKKVGSHNDAVRGVSFHPKGHLFASASDDRTIKLWSLSCPIQGKNTPCLFPKITQKQIFRGHLGWVRQVKFTPKGDRLISCSFDQTIRVWDLNGTSLQLWGKPLDLFNNIKKNKISKKIRWQKHFFHHSDISDIDIDKSGQFVLSTGHRSAIINLPDDGTTARLWNYKTGQLLCHLKGHLLGITHGQFNPKRKEFATTSEDGTVRIYRYH